jgi:hypothetical protein
MTVFKHHCNECGVGFNEERHLRSGRVLCVLHTRLDEESLESGRSLGQIPKEEHEIVDGFDIVSWIRRERRGELPTSPPVEDLVMSDGTVIPARSGL